MSALFEIEALGVAYPGEGSSALSDVTLAVAAGERLAVIGESGSGKSTLALAVAGLLPRGTRVTRRIAWPALGSDQPVHGRDVGFVFQDAGSSLNPVLTVGEQVAEVVRRHRGKGWREAMGAARELLDRVRLPDPYRALRAYPHQLSGGQRQRVGIASAIAAGPKLLIADEPTSALDTVVQAEIVALLDRLVREDGMALLFITHDIALAAGFADRIAVLHDGRMVELGEANEVIERPGDAYTRHLLASHLTLDAPPLIGRAAR